MNGSNEWEGRVEVYHAGHWGAVWEPANNLPWKTENVQVVCGQLGYSGGRAVYGSFFGNGEADAPVWLSDVDCNGDEERLSDCPNGGWGVQLLFTYSVTNQRGIGVACKPTSNTTEEPYGDIRLVGGTDAYSGRVEIYGPSGYGTVCDYNTNSNIGRVICRQHGYSYSTYHRYSYFGGSTHTVWMMYVSCYGNEERLEYCSFRGWKYEPRCSNSREFGVTCSPP
ncbi:neurotrypsin-like [Pecten maximus]|uniref:neurotrypsin-like n=1 Tax=Pecten maximus TaxID=6579 RepID=UPI0014580D41|nr:neurotrypsin-like [Pecten maximus]